MDTVQWEYRYESLGSIWHGAKDQDVATLLTMLGEEGWEVISMFSPGNTSIVKIAAKRPLTTRVRRERSMPAYR